MSQLKFQIKATSFRFRCMHRPTLSRQKTTQNNHTKNTSLQFSCRHRWVPPAAADDDPSHGTPENGAHGMTWGTGGTGTSSHLSGKCGVPNTGWEIGIPSDTHRTCGGIPADVPSGGFGSPSRFGKPRGISGRSGAGLVGVSGPSSWP